MPPHINVLEFCVIRFAVISFSDILRGRRVLIQMEKTATVYCFNKQGGTGSGRFYLGAVAVSIGVPGPST